MPNESIIDILGLKLAMGTIEINELQKISYDFFYSFAHYIFRFYFSAEEIKILVYLHNKAVQPAKLHPKAKKLVIRNF